jgi:hypothetical protein
MKKQKWAVFFLLAGRLAASSSFSFVQMIAGNGQDRVSAVAAGPDGSLYIVGTTTSTNFATTIATTVPFGAPANANVAQVFSPPYSAPAGSGPLTLLVNGQGLQPGWQALWNGAPRPTQFLSQYQLQLTLDSPDTDPPSLAFVSVADATGEQVRQQV